jgi:hypothetical protein
MPQAPAVYLPYTSRTEATLKRLSAMKPETLAVMHGATFNGNCEKAIRDLNEVMKKRLV